jgi:hypothetical protein
MTVNLFYIGDNFYWETKTSMSPIYECNTFARYDWGFVQRDLKEGKTVIIRPANEQEMMWAKSKAYDIKKYYEEMEKQKI